MSASVPRPAGPASPATGTIVVPIIGMTCRACERRIERQVRRIPNVREATASASRARVEVVTSGPVSGVDLAEAIEAAGYEVGRTPWVTRDARTWMAAGAGLVLIVAVAILAEVTGLAGFASGAGDIREGGLIVAGLLGLAAGVSTCMALVGGLVLALSAAAAARRPADEDPSLATRLRPTVTFLGGRVAGFAVLGAGLGALGSRVVLPSAAIAVLMIVVAVVMTVLGVRLTGLSPRLAGWSPTLPGSLGARLGPGRRLSLELLGHPGRGPRRRVVLPAVRVHPGRAGLRAVDGVAAGRRRDHGRLRPRDGARAARARRAAERASEGLATACSCARSASSSSASPR